LRRPARRSFGVTGIAAAIAREPVALLGLALVLVYVGVALTVGILPLRDPLLLSTHRLEPPSAAFPLGTDALGRDLLSRILFGARLSMQVAVFSVAVATVVGGILGLVSGYLGGAVDLVVGRAMDVLFSFPAILLALGTRRRARSGSEQRDHRDRRRVHAHLRARRTRTGARAEGA